LITARTETEVAEGATIHAYTEDEQVLGSTYDPHCGFRFMNLTAGVHTFTIKYKTTNVSGTAKIRRARLELWRVS
jgi:hypothetical protein